MKYYSHDDVYSSLEAITPLSLDQIRVVMNSLTPVPMPDRERIRMELWCKLYSYPSTNEPRWDLQAAMNDFDKQFPK